MIVFYNYSKYKKYIQKFIINHMFKLKMLVLNYVIIKS